MLGRIFRGKPASTLFRKMLQAPLRRSSFGTIAPPEVFFPRRRRHCRFGCAPLDWMTANDADQPRELSMQYLLLIYQNEAEMGAPGSMLDEYRAFTQGIIQNGNFKAGDALQRTSAATTVRVRGGKTLTTDGPFAETREQ